MKSNIIRIITGIVLVISLISGVWLFDDRYVSAGEMSDMKSKIYLRMDTDEYRALTKQYYEYKKILRENPGDINLHEQIEEIKKELEKLKARIDEALRNGAK